MVSYPPASTWPFTSTRLSASTASAIGVGVSVYGVVLASFDGITFAIAVIFDGSSLRVAVSSLA